MKRNERPLYERIVAAFMTLVLVMNINWPVTALALTETTDTTDEPAITQVETPAEEQTTEPATSEPEPTPVETPASEPAATTPEAPATTPEPAATISEPAPAQTTVASAPAAPTTQATTAAAPAAQVAEPETTEVPDVPKPARISVVVTIDYMTTSGTWATRTLNKTITSGGSASIAASTVSSYQRNVSAGGTTNVFTGWADANGNAVTFPLTISYDEAFASYATSSDGKAHLNYTATYEQHDPITVTLHFEGIRNSNGSITSSVSSNTLSWGSSSSFGKTRLESATGVKVGNSSKANFTYGGIRYTYTGQWMDENGNIIDLSSNISVKYGKGTSSGNTIYTTSDIDFYFYPVYDTTTIQGFELHYIDNVCTGTGSWSNLDAFGTASDFASLSHTFTNPEVASPNYAPHYHFVNWTNFETGETFGAGETYTYKVNSSQASGTTTVVNFYAMWQPSVTVNYHDANGTTTVEKFDDDVNVYADHASATDADGNAFEGWYDADGNRIDEKTIYDLPEITSEANTATTYDVYARYYPAITVTTTGGEWVYDGTAHGATVEVEIANAEDFADYTVEASSTATATDVTAEAIAATADVITVTNAQGNVDLSNLRVTYVDGTILVTPAPISVTTESASKTFDGTALTADGEISGLVAEQSATLVATGSQTIVGSSENTYEIVWNGTASESNYEVVSEELGTLTVTAAPIIPTPTDVTPNPTPIVPAAITPAPVNPTVPAATATETPAPAAEPTVEPEVEPEYAPDTTDIADAQVPMANIADDENPLVMVGSWALVNLLCTVLTVICALGMVVTFIKGRDEDENENTEDEDETNRRKAKLMGLIPAIVSVVAFILTEDMSLPMALIDKWTLLMVVILAVSLVAALLTRNKDNDEDEDMAQTPAIA